MAEAEAVDRGDRDEGRPRKPCEELLAAAGDFHHLLDWGVEVGDELAEVGAGDEDAGLGRGDHQPGEVFALGEGVEMLLEFRKHGAREDVRPLGRIVEDQQRDVGFGEFERENRSVGHGLSLASFGISGM